MKYDTKSKRNCQTCGSDISGRHSNARYCDEVCRSVARNTYQLESVRKYRERNAQQLCVVCGVNQRYASYLLCRDCYNAEQRLRRTTNPQEQDRLQSNKERRKAWLPPCSIEGCPNQSFTDALCHRHYAEKRRKDPKRPRCLVAWCGKAQVYSVGFCQSHYFQHLNYNLAPERLVALLNPGCEVCGTTKGLQIDHNHNCCDEGGSCGNCVRGALCRPHNMAVRYVHDDPDEAEAVAKYLRNQAKPI